MAGRNDPDLEMALLRYEVISAYLAMEPARGQRGRLLKQLAKKTWQGPNGEPLCVSAETIRAWVRRYREGGLDGLRDQVRVVRGPKALCLEAVQVLPVRHPTCTPGKPGSLEHPVQG